MTQSQIFTESHKMTKSLMQKGISYSATFGLCLRYMYSINLKKIETMTPTFKINSEITKGTEKQIRFASRIKRLFQEFLTDMEEDYNDEYLTDSELSIVSKMEQRMNEKGSDSVFWINIHQSAGQVYKILNEGEKSPFYNIFFNA